MLLKIIFCLMLFNIYSTSFASEEINIDILVSGGYSALNIDGNKYNGYNASAKLFFPIIPSLSLGFGGKYISVSDNIASHYDQVNGNQKNNFKSILAGLDLAYIYKTDLINLLVNPYVYYGINNSWQRESTFNQMNNTITVTGSPNVSKNLIYGFGIYILFKIENIYLGPSTCFSQGYLETQNYTDSRGATMPSTSGNYYNYDLNFTIGAFL
ncbi:hypothetical protein QEJ31_15040 [Pigmentibacter sp. JX0631]|uniref:hypothetical protein n=1 Tax=Pigmentibacter sp. JX0631 TaxID=2976982 RepID=UPI00246834D2|nr:hypothetical protein [Pigmentibacter sp. JX0631]WGL59845.1 hypothetical protein QEJ31_15040 [Pigmentibacter sp. JX0631]